MVAICALLGTGGVALLFYALNITLILPTLMLMAHWVDQTIHRFKVLWSPPVRAKHSGTRTLHRNWHYYDGVLYDTAIEPLARELRQETTEEVAENSRTLDLCCGTGGLVFQLAEKCAHVTGADHAQGMIQYARQRRAQRGLTNVTFVHADARFLSDFEDQRFDSAILSLALHEMPRASGLRVLKEAARVAKEIIIVDYAVPLPTHTQGIVSRYLEVIAGLSHLRSFLDYTRHLGLDSLVADAGLAVKSDRAAMSQCIRIVRAVSNETQENRTAASQC
jgi:SAM-dependent methyltransferase